MVTEKNGLVKDFVSKPIEKETIEIKYKTSSYDTFPCIATCRYQEQAVSGCGETFDEAKNRLIGNIKKLQKQKQIPLPPNETIEL